jgi:hypothetical protein
MTLRKIAAGSGHRYTDDGSPVPGVTTILSGGFPKPALVGWAARESAAYVINHWTDLQDMAPSERGRAVEQARFNSNREATARGREIHSYGEALAKGEVVDVPERLYGPAKAYADWLNRWHVEVTHTECPVINRRHNYAGTFDLLARIDGESWLIDLKTGKGVFAETALQLAAYRYAEALLLPDGSEVVMPNVDRVGVAHVLSDSVRLLPVDAGADTFRLFLYVAQVAAFMRAVEAGDSPIGDAIDPTEARLRVAR